MSENILSTVLFYTGGDGVKCQEAGRSRQVKSWVCASVSQQDWVVFGQVGKRSRMLPDTRQLAMDDKVTRQPRPCT